MRVFLIALLAAISYAQTAAAVDVIFMLDGSGSMSLHNWQSSKDVTKLWMNAFSDEISSPLRFGLMEFSTLSSQELNLTSSSDREKIDQHLDSMMKNDGLTYYKRALQAFEKQIKTNRVGIYSKSWVLGVIISDGEPTDNLDKLIAYVNYLKQNATLMVVLVGERYSGAKAFRVTSCDLDGYKFPTNDCVWWNKFTNFEKLKRNVTEIADRIVKEAHLGSSKTSPTPSQVVRLVIYVEGLTEENKDAVCSAIVLTVKGTYIEYCSLEEVVFRRRLKLRTRKLYMGLRVEDKEAAKSQIGSEGFIDSVQNLPDDITVLGTSIQSPSTPSDSNEPLDVKMVIIVVISAIFVVSWCFFCYYYFCINQKSKNSMLLEGYDESSGKRSPEHASR